MTDSFDKIFGDKKKVLVVFAHPDDAELYSGGLIARLTSEGKEVRVVKMTSGNKGSRQEKITSDELSLLREKEDSYSMKVLGISEKNNIYLRYPDGEVENDLKTIGQIAQQIRLFRPELVITHNPEDIIIRFNKDEAWINHRDHRNTGKSVIDASYPYSRDILFFPEHFEDRGAESHRVIEFLLVDFYGHEDTVGFDVTKYIETRVKAHSAHSSQYSKKAAQESADFFTKTPGTEKRFEKFRYIKAD